MSKRQLCIKNILYNTGFKSINQLVALFILPLFVKNIGLELYGIWVISGVIIGYLGVFDLGFSNGIMKYISEAYSKKDMVQFNHVFSSSAFLLFIVV
jgi:O-antigen/teichoic acid export membrane protein